ncbi:MAG: peptidoglycan bridge formation glycyltransferase FemA/FemB family protein [Chloroflexota bacterium]|nr:peptidoglycan bridge formation glycyltransferase FemA/FemB family protein [Chloroflexota bacterium]
MKRGEGWIPRRFVLDDGPRRAGVAQVLLKTGPLGITLAYAPRGPLVDGGDLPDALRALGSALTAERCAGLLADPEIAPSDELDAALARSGARPAGVFVQPRRTLLMDLGRTPDELLAAMRKKTRQYIHKAEREGVVTEETRDIDRFLAVLVKVAARDRFAVRSRAYFERLLGAFGDAARITMSRVGAEDDGALLAIHLGDRAWELYGGWSGAHGESRPFYLLKWRSLMAMKQRGVVRYDMWGLSEREGDELAGIENFKLGFGGDVVTWIGAFDRPVIAPLYPLWRVAGRRRLAAAAR